MDAGQKAFAFGASPIGGFLVGLALAWPADCEPGTANCTNILGQPAFAENEPAATTVAAGIGLMCCAVAWLGVMVYNGLEARRATRQSSATGAASPAKATATTAHAATAPKREVHCPSCNILVEVPDNTKARRARCRNCRTVFNL